MKVYLLLPNHDGDYDLYESDQQFDSSDIENIVKIRSHIHVETVQSILHHLHTHAEYDQTIKENKAFGG